MDKIEKDKGIDPLSFLVEVTGNENSVKFKKWRNIKEFDDILNMWFYISTP